MRTKKVSHPEVYREVSISIPLLLLCIVASVLSTVLSVFTEAWVWSASVTLAAVVVFLLFYQVRVELDHEELTLRYGVGIAKRHIPLSQIVSTSIESNDKPLAWFYQPLREGCLVLKLRSGAHVAVPVREQRAFATMLNVKER